MECYKLFKIIFILIFLLGMCFGNAFGSQPETKSYPNYLIILVHGINTTHRLFMGEGENGSDVSNIPDDERYPWGDLKGYLENDLGLMGYVYTYTFSERDGRVPLEGHELGDPNWNNQAALIGGTLHHDPAGKEIGKEATLITDIQNGNHTNQGNSWFEQAREDFIKWKADNYYGGDKTKVSTSEIPDNYIIIAHSMGGLSARSYFASDYYQDNVIKYISIAAQQQGSNGALALKRLSEFYESGEVLKHFGSMLGITAALLYGGFNKFAAYTGVSAILLLGGHSMVDTLFVENKLGSYPQQPGTQDMAVGSEFINGLNSKPFINNSSPLKVRMISGRGVPTPSGDLPTNRYFLGLEAVQTILSSEYLNDLPMGAKIMAVYMSVGLGAIINQDGDIYGTHKSQIADGLTSLNESNIDFKSYSYKFGDDTMDPIKDAMIGLLGAMAAAETANLFGGPLITVPIKFGLIVGQGTMIAELVKDKYENYVSAHGLILRKIYEEKIIDQALDDTTLFGGSSVSGLTKSGISASSVNYPTASYSAPEQAFSLLSNLDENGNTVSDYHTVTIEAYTEGGGAQSELFPIEFDGQKKWVSAVTVKEAPTAMKGVINTFLPKKLKQFQYSENFAAWKDVGEVDEWGNFTLTGLNLAEGQNVIGFKAESWTGNKSNQHFKIILNTVPMQASNYYPEGSTGNVNQEIGTEFVKSNYTNDPSEIINIISFKIDENEVLQKAVVDATQGGYKSNTKTWYIPQEPLTEGLHSVTVQAQSNVGVSQAMWTFYVDTTAPLVSVSTLEPYSPRAPTAGKLTVKYKTSDNISSYLNNVSLRLYKGTQPDENSNFITEITQIPTQAAGEQFVTWDGKDGNGNFVEDGIYIVRVKAFDQAGNWGASMAQVAIDSTPPQIIEANVSPNPMSKQSKELNFTAKISEKSTVFLKLTNLTKNQSTAYVTQGEDTAGYTWQFDNPFFPNLEDGIYRLEATARDEAGNESVAYVINNIRIDRTPPEIFGQYADPFVLSNSGQSPYTTDFHYQLSEENCQVNIKLYYENTGEEVGSWGPFTSGKSGIVVSWDGNSAEYPKGSYKFQIRAEDDIGNYSVAYATCVKDGIAPIISYPAENGQEINGTVSIRGTAMDPDWTNDKGFKEYRVYYAQGESSIPGSLGLLTPDWKADFIEVPEIYREPGSEKNRSIRPLQNDATLAYLFTNFLQNGKYTVLIIAEEEGGDLYAASRVVEVKNDEFTASGAGANPVISLGEIPSEMVFDGSNELPVKFYYGGKDLNAYVEIYQRKIDGTLETVHYKYFPELKSEFYVGKPEYKVGEELGYFIWQDELGWHVRWNGEAGEAHRFNGSFVAAGNISNLSKIGEGINQASSIVSWDRTQSGGEGGFDLQIDADQIIISTWLDNDPNSQEDEFSSLVIPYFGLSKYQPANSPVIITGIKSQSASNIEILNWNGKLETGGFVNNGDYVIKVRAEGMDGTGLALEEKNIKVSTPFELTNVSASTSTFNPVGYPDRVTVSYNLSKDAHIQLKVFKPGDPEPLAIINDGIQPGKINPDFPHKLSWRGNYPDKEGTQVVTSGEYVLKLVAAAVDGTETIEKDITPNISVQTLDFNPALASLDPIGEDKKYNGGYVKAVQGSSDYYWEAKASGTYYPPINYSYTLGVKGLQKASLYPYVPFSGILHRGFDRVFGKIKVKFKIHCWKHKYNILGQVDGTKHGTLDRESELSFFELTKDVPKYDELIFPFSASDLGWKGINKIEVSVLFYSSSGFLLDDMNDEYMEAQWNTLTLSPKDSSKGIFRIKAERTYTGASFNEKCQAHINVSLAEDFKYSRLTNRFVPWYGFVNNNHPSEEVFDNVLADLSKLGFPGESYFDDTEKSDDEYKNEVGGEYSTDVYDTDIYKNSSGNPNIAELNEKTKAKTKGLTTKNAQDSYLSGETLEFIPINVPDAGEFVFKDNIWIEGKTIDNTYRDILKQGLSSYRIEAATGKRISYRNDNHDVKVKWPYDEIDVKEKNVELLTPLAGLIKDPQNYNISNTAYEIDNEELKSRDQEFKNLPENEGLVQQDGWFKRRNISGALLYSKMQGRYLSDKIDSLGSLIDPPDYVSEYTYSDFDRSIIDLNFSYDANNKNDDVEVSLASASYGQTWSSIDDPLLADAEGILRGGPEIFNKNGFSAAGRSEPIYFKKAYLDKLKYQNYSGPNQYKYTFWAEDKDPNKGNIVDNPCLEIDTWQVELKDLAERNNEDLEEVNSEDIFINSSNILDHYFRSKLKYHAKERRFVEPTGKAATAYELMYFDGENWIKFAEGNPSSDNTFNTFWDVGRLCGKYTVLLKTDQAIAGQDVHVGDIVYYGDSDEENKRVTSAYKRAEVVFQPTSFSEDQFASITPVTMSEIYIHKKPIILTHGPIVELKPSPYKFKTPDDGGDLRPYLRFSYTAEDLKEGYGIITLPDDPNWKNKTQDLWIHHVTANGDLELVQDKDQKLLQDADGNLYFAFEGVVDHFSTYALLKGKFQLSAPIVYASSYITNQDTVTIYGTAEPGSILSLYVKTENIVPDPEKSESYVARMTAEADTGEYKFEDVSLLQEGDNYIFVTSHLEADKSVRTYSVVTIRKDTIPPVVSAKPNLYVFSPNGDGKYDSVDYLLKTNEKGKIYLSVQSPMSKVAGQLINEEISAEPNKEYKINWAENSVKIYKPGATTNWIEVGERMLPSTCSDGEYFTTVYAIDEAGNISDNFINRTIVDTASPVVLGLNADPNPFTPNDDGIKDTTTFNYQFTEPAYVTLNIFRDNESLFCKHESATENFKYPTLPVTGSWLQVSSGNWTWDGRGSRNELIGGEYNYSIIAEDWVGNSVSSGASTIVVDRAPSLVPYAYAEPDPFSPVNPNNSFTEIIYYLARDNLKVSVYVFGENDKPIKTLVNNEIQSKGEHAVRWYGDFESGYDGPTAVKNIYRVGDGSYQFRVYVEDPDGGQPANITNTVLVDNTPPYIVAKPVQVDYVAKKATLIYGIPENSTVEVSVCGEDNSFIANLESAEEKFPGDYSLIYDFGQTNDLGPKYFKIIAIDRARNSAEKITETFAVNQNPLQIADHFAVPDTFTPNGDGHTDLMRISYTISGGEPDYKVTIDILNPTGSTVKHLIESEMQASGTYSFYWDGKGDDKQYVSDGNYEYVITVEDKQGSSIEQGGSILVVSTRPTVDLSSDISIFSPNGDGFRDTVIFNYSIGYPVAYITGEALVKLEVINATGEAVWSKIFNHTAGTYAYEYDGKTTGGSQLATGNYYVKASAEDALGSTAVPKMIELEVDNALPEPSDFVIDPQYAKLGAKVTISLDFGEELAENPDVSIIKSDLNVAQAALESVSENLYIYSYTIGVGDSEGVTTVSVEARDQAFNPIIRTKTFVIDKTDPQISNLSVNPDPASVPDVSGPVSIKFNFSEPLKEAPEVYVTQSGASPQLAAASGDWSQANGQCEARYNVFSGNDGPALITVEVTDLAGNTFVDSFDNLLTVDTIVPTFSNIQSEISSNPEFLTYAREGSVVTIRFNTSEDLNFNPDVKVNGNPASYDSLNSNEYSYQYTVSGSDDEGNATITISGFDFAGNEGIAETSSSSESFVIDLVNPTVAIASPETGMIANPGSFATNANPDGTDRPRSTTFYYESAEYSKVTVKVHKVSDDQTTYVKEDFSGSNLIATLVDNIWQQGGIQQSVNWDGKIENNQFIYDTNNDGYADPGKYAFIVEGRDKAGNLTLIKWGGTVWIQNNVLGLREPDQQEYDNAGLNPKGNPDPPYISPNGNSADPTQKRARLYFMIDLSLDPPQTDAPEKIEAAAVIAETKKIGKYSVKVYSDSGLTNLVRTVTSEADAWAATLSWEDWDGKDDADQFVSDGTYYMVVDVRDYAGNPANNNPLKRAVVVDNTFPEILNLSAVPYYFSPGVTDSTIKATILEYEISDNGGKAEVTVDVYKGSTPVKTLLSDVWQNNGTYSQTWDGNGQTGYVGTANGGGFEDGVYTFNISAFDEAGNSAEVKTVDVYVDTQGPNPPTLSSVSHNGGDYSPIDPDWSAHGSPNITWSDPGDNGGSGVSRYEVSVDGGSWVDLGAQTSWHSTLEDGEGRTVDIRAVDALGITGTAARLTFKIDTVDPYFATGPTIDHTPVDIWSTHSSPNITFSVADAISGVKEVRGYIDGIDQGIISSGWHPTLSDGTHTVLIRVYDNAGRYGDSPTYTFKIDTAPPNPPSVTVSHTPVNTWSNHNSPYFIWADPGDGNGSGVSYYRGYIDNVDQGNVSSGWHLTLSDGTHTVYIKAVDGVGLSSNSQTFTFKIDTVAPVIAPFNSGTFNPYVDNNITINISASDQLPSSGFSADNIIARIKYGSNIVKNLSIYSDGGNSYHVVWDGTNNSNDYENEGNYTLEISASDEASNPASIMTSTIALQDDQYIAQGSEPEISFVYVVLSLQWINGWDDTELRDVSANVTEDDHGNCAYGPGGNPNYADKSDPFTIETAQGLEVSAAAWGEDSEYHAIKRNSDDAVVWEIGGTGDNDGNSHYFTGTIQPGTYYAYIDLNDAWLYSTYGHTKVWYYDRRYKQYTKNSTDYGKNWGATSGPNLVYSYSTGPTSVTVNGITHTVFSGGGLFYKRNNSTPVKIATVGDQPAIAADAQGNAYVAWHCQVGLNSQILFQKIPYNFARVTGTFQGSSVVAGEKQASSQQTTFEAPTLVFPDDQSDVRTLRPTFSWKHHKGNTQEYKLDLAKNEAFNIDHQTFTKDENAGSLDKDDPSLYHYTYSIHEFDPGLDRDTYYWKVSAFTTSEAATSEVRSFTVAPQLTLTGVTNYPNPFNPNKETTKIRYRLGADADEVKIRVYDVVGSLVKEISNCPTDGEGSSIWQKYNDVEWDGRNGRGDKVVNGIYPFEVIARLGDRSVSARGKIAVLK